MDTNKIDILIIRGAPASGKSQTAKSLTKYFPKGVRMEIDNLRSMVISVDWTNQSEHIDILNLSTRLVNDFLQLGFSPIIIIDTFSGDKIINYHKMLKSINNELNIEIFGLYTTEEELERRLDMRDNNLFKDFPICKKLNNDTVKFKHENETQIDTTNLISDNTAKIIYKEIIKNTSIPSSSHPYWK